MATERFAEQLRALRTAVGNPSFRKMAGRSGRISHTTLHEAAAGTRFPSWETTREFVRACDADEVQWRCRWEDAQRAGPIQTLPEGGLAPAGTDSPDGEGAPGTTDATTVGAVAVQTSGAVGMAAVDGPAGSGVAASPDLPPAGERAPRARRARLPWLVTAATVVVSTAVVLGVTVRDRSSLDGSGAAAAPTSAAAFSDSMVPGDSSQFVADVTIPDGARVKVNAQFVKVWALANVGTVHWHDRFLARTSPAPEEDGCQVPDRVAIGDTPPGAQVMISVPVTAPSRPGQCWVSWKMVDEHGQAYFPSRRPVYFMVTVTD
ncbi:NBR1-Ig-like domain-containing protein [Micromonospora aurantiaca (nom. illeg.)]|uniref:NBR1-Ig-like domain-containing protein n=1 Tax=Micromonospora aurantiaca (nom. illeg.) TaxID=47850 RepID=UPI0033EBEC05